MTTSDKLTLLSLYAKLLKAREELGHTQASERETISMLRRQQDHLTNRMIKLGVHPYALDAVLSDILS